MALIMAFMDIVMTVGKGRIMTAEMAMIWLLFGSQAICKESVTTETSQGLEL